MTEPKKIKMTGLGWKGSGDGWKAKKTGIIPGRKPQSSETCLNIFKLAET